MSTATVGVRAIPVRRHEPAVMIAAGPSSPVTIDSCSVYSADVDG